MAQANNIFGNLSVEQRLANFQTNLDAALNRMQAFCVGSPKHDAAVRSVQFWQAKIEQEYKLASMC